MARLLTRYRVISLAGMSGTPHAGLDHPARRSADAKLCLEFVNTVAWRNTAVPEERLPSAQAVADWCAAAGLIGARERSRLAAALAEAPAADALYRTALGFRDATYRLLRARIDGKPGAAADFAALNTVIAAMPRRQVLAPGPEGIGWHDADRPASALDMLAPLVWSAADLLSGPRAERVKQCADPKGCGWLFLDESRTGTRRWCSMGDCGNRAKARRHYERSRADAG